VSVRRLLARRDGALAVESAFVLPLVLLLVMGGMEAARLFFVQSTLTYAVQEAARCAVVQPGVCGTPAQIAMFAARRAAGAHISPSAFQVSAPACGLQVSGQVSFGFVAQKLFQPAPMLRAQACRPLAADSQTEAWP
jgi:Flp pilus assembly protein TadG